jgi:hypothetical protein
MLGNKQIKTRYNKTLHNNLSGILEFIQIFVNYKLGSVAYVNI